MSSTKNPKGSKGKKSQSQSTGANMSNNDNDNNGSSGDAKKSATLFRTPTAIDKTMSFRRILLKRNIGEEVTVLKTSADIAQHSLKELTKTNGSTGSLTELRSLVSNETFIVDIMAKIFKDGKRKMSVSNRPFFDFMKIQVESEAKSAFPKYYTGTLPVKEMSCFVDLFTCFMHATGCLQDPVEADICEPKYKMILQHSDLKVLMKQGYIETLFTETTNSVVGGKFYNHSVIEKFVRAQFSKLVNDINKLLTIERCVEKFYKGILYHILIGKPSELEGESVISQYSDVMNFHTPDLLASLTTGPINLDTLKYEQTHDDYLRRTFDVWFNSLINNKKVLVVTTEQFASMYNVYVIRSITGSARVTTLITRAAPNPVKPAICERSSLKMPGSSYIYSTFHDPTQLNMLHQVVNTDLQGILEDVLTYRQRNSTQVKGVELIHMLVKSKYKDDGRPIMRDVTDTQDPIVKYKDCSEDWFLAASTSNNVKYYWYSVDGRKNSVKKDCHTKFEFTSSDNEAAIKVAKEYGSMTQFMAATVHARLCMLEEQRATVMPPYTMELVDRVNSEFKMRSSIYMQQSINETMKWWFSGLTNLKFIQNNMPVAQNGNIVPAKMEVTIPINRIVDANPGLETAIGVDTNYHRYQRDLLTMIHELINLTGKDLANKASVTKYYSDHFAKTIKQGGRYDDIDKLPTSAVDPASALMPLLADLINNPSIVYVLEMIIEQSTLGHNRPRTPDQHKAYLEALAQTAELLLEVVHTSRGTIARNLYRELIDDLLKNATIIDILAKTMMTTIFGGRR